MVVKLELVCNRKMSLLVMQCVLPIVLERRLRIMFNNQELLHKHTW